ncbi:YciI family protein [Gryllotalpicola daejeonensis]
MSRFLILIYGDDEKWGERTAEAGAAVDAAHRAFREAGGVVASGELDSPALAKTIHGRAGERAYVTDGPFAEFKEVLGGYYEIEAESIDEAVARASTLYETNEPHVRIEVRPLVAH